MSFTIAIIGRPNVGKSTLFNRLTGRRSALVDDQPGVTRDRREGFGHYGNVPYKVIDTAGLENAGADTLAGRMLAQTKLAIEAADAIFFLVDARAGLMPVDRSFADLVRRSGKPVILVANKSESRASEAGRLEAFALGLGEPIGISAEHNEGIGELFDELREVLPEQMEQREDEDEPDREDDDARPIRVAVVGRPNVGKSTLINRLIGEERLLTGPEAGITRDTIAVDFTWHGRKFLLHDTAGMRRRPKVQEKVEKLSVADALNAIRFAEVVVLLMDAQQAFEDQDLRIADLVEREGRALVLGMSKWDLAERKPGALTRLREDADRHLAQVKDVPLIGVSGLNGEGLDRLMQAVLDAHAVWNKRVTTSALNRFLEQALAANPPPAVSGRTLKLNYMTQPKARPPSFVLFCTRADKIPDSYMRYLTNGLRERFELPGTPIRIALREKKNPYARKR
jgi:GTPase